jgi:2-hydroxychromene-2-carboxylate isomerase
MHDLLLTRQDHLRITDLIKYAGEIGIDEDRFHQDMTRDDCTDHITANVESADLSGVSGTPTFFINGRRHYGSYDVETLEKAIKLARIRAKIAAKRSTV